MYCFSLSRREICLQHVLWFFGAFCSSDAEKLCHYHYGCCPRVMVSVSSLRVTFRRSLFSSYIPSSHDAPPLVLLCFAFRARGTPAFTYVERTFVAHRGELFTQSLGWPQAATDTSTAVDTDCCWPSVSRGQTTDTFPAEEPPTTRPSGDGLTCWRRHPRRVFGVRELLG